MPGLRLIHAGYKGSSGEFGYNEDIETANRIRAVRNVLMGTGIKEYSNSITNNLSYPQSLGYQLFVDE